MQKMKKLAKLRNPVNIYYTGNRIVSNSIRVQRGVMPSIHVYHESNDDITK